MLYEKITLDMLTERGVSVKMQKYVEDGGQELEVGAPYRCAYANSARGRAELAQSLPQPYLTAVMAVWGDRPVMDQSISSDEEDAAWPSDTETGETR